MSLSSVRGRFAPSPTGGFHLGSALVALVSWLSVRSQGGVYIWRVEDIDGPRVIPGASDQQMTEARWLGIDWDEGPDIGGPLSPYAQSERGNFYELALAKLARSNGLFPCALSRTDLRELASAPHSRLGAPAYSKDLRPSDLWPDWFETHNTAANPEAALRFKVDDGLVSFRDLVMGDVAETVSETVGDFVLKRRDGVYAYQLAVVVDDLDMGVTEVVRGADLLDSTARQIQLINALGGTVPAYAHLPLIVDGTGEKLSKRNAALTLSELKAADIHPQAIVSWLAHSIGLAESLQPVAPSDLVEHFAWERIRSTNISIPADLTQQLRLLST